MGDLISREAMLDFAHNHINGTIDCNDIARFPAVDAVEVVRCEKCVYRGQYLMCPMFFYCQETGETRDFTRDNGFCHRGVKKGQEEERVPTDEALWLIVKEAGFHDGVLYTTPMIACSECGVAALHEESEGMGHGGPQISCRWHATHYCPNCGEEMKNWRII